jgi:thioredoxin-like negative regulator of GroEL
MQLDLSPLLRPSLYAPVPTTAIAAPFLDTTQQPAPDTDLEVLLSHRRFIHAADKATDILTSGSVSPSSTQKILELLYTRFSCLVIVNQTSLAAKEAKPLVELLARESGTYTRPYREIFLSQVPWSLRLLLLKLSGLGADVHRRTIMGLYALSTDCRTLAARAKSENDDASFKLWKSRLQDLGLRVAGELIEMGELETARRHLDTLSLDTSIDAEEEVKTRIRKTLLLLKLGDIQAAETCLAASTSSSTTSTDTDTDTSIQLKVLTALTHFSTSPSTALSSLQSLADQYPSNPLISHNLAIANLYTNNVVLGSEILESLVTKDEVVFPTLLFNLSTMYELRTERARERKLDLVDLVVGLGDVRGEEARVGGFERGLGEFKLT